jgi:aminopeptidase N
VTVHELAHMWFGDSVTPATWQDIWLNEGLATFTEFLWIEHTRGTAAMEDEIAGQHGTLGLIPHRPPGDPGIDEMFGISVYQRGALTLHALRREIGDDALFAALQAYASRYAYGNAATADFIAVVEEVSGRDLGDFFSAWLYEPEVPPLPEG